MFVIQTYWRVNCELITIFSFHFGKEKYVEKRLNDVSMFLKCVIFLT